jgi:hypothetical protein
MPFYVFAMLAVLGILALVGVLYLLAAAGFSSEPPGE